MKLYAIAASAGKPERGTGTIVRVGVSVCTASSEEMALGLALKAAWKEYPQDKGWANHAVQVKEIPTSLMLEVLGIDQEGKE